jgi:hypothetical protein
LQSIRILAQIDLPSGTLRWWDGSGGPFVDGDGNIYRACVLTEDALPQIEAAINGEAATLSLVVSGIDSRTSDNVWEDYQNGNVVGSRFRVMLQKLDQYEQPVGTPKIKFTGKIANLTFVDQTDAIGIRSTIQIDISNRFTLLSVTSGAVLSDVDQRARARVINPSAPDDRFCERIPTLKDKTVRWPNW